MNAWGGDMTRLLRGVKSIKRGSLYWRQSCFAMSHSGKQRRRMKCEGVREGEKGFGERERENKNDAGGNE